MSTFGTGGFFFCVVAVCIGIAVIEDNWMPLVALAIFIYGYIQLMGAANSTFYPNGDLRPRRRRRGRRRDRRRLS